MKTMNTSVVAAAAVLMAGTTFSDSIFAETFTVCPDGSCDFTDIQSAINASTEGATIAVYPGTYVGSGDSVITLPAHDISILGSGESGSIVVDGENARRGLLASSLGQTGITVDGITFQNGRADLGAGIRLTNSDVAFTNCVIRNNSTPPGPNPYRFGGGVLVEGTDCNPTFSYCEITNNFAVHGGGIAHAIDGSNPLNQTQQPVFANCQISGNSAYWSGGGIYMSSSAGQYIECNIQNNSCSNNNGGGMFISSSSPQITDCTILGNAVTGSGQLGAGIACGYSSPAITGCTISDNTLPSNNGRGSGIDFSNSSATVMDSTIQGNNNGPGVAVLKNTALELGSSIICGNPSGQIAGEYTDLGENCITDNCEDSDSDGIFDCDDPCPDWPGDCTDDGLTIYVVAGQSIQEAVDLCPEGGTVVVGPGTYFGTGTSVITLPDRGISIIGSGGPATTVVDGQDARRGLIAVGGGDNGTIIDGLTFTNGFADGPDGTYEGCGGGILLECSSPTFIDCVFTNNHSEQVGGGVALNGSCTDPTFIDCEMSWNTAVSGAGVAAFYGDHAEKDDTNPSFDGCLITQNQSAFGAGGVWINYITTDFNDCRILSNTAQTNSGGGIGVNGSVVSIADCTISGNSASNDGGGVTAGNTTLTITNTSITNNTAAEGGGFLASIVQLDIQDCTFDGNTANSSGAGSLVTTSGQIINSTFTNNVGGTTGGFTGGAFTIGDGELTIGNCLFEGNASGDGGAIRFSGDCDTTLVECTLRNNTAYDRGGGIFCTITDNANVDIRNCVITSNHAEGHPDGPMYGGGFASGISPGSPALTETQVCDNTPDQYAGEYIDNGNNCINDSCDTDGDGEPDTCTHCPGDITENGEVNAADLGILLALWGTNGENNPGADINQDGIVNAADLGLLLGFWGGCP
ncbi:MAG: right-handed parallel beta-helix repeat-containing protein [Phycisphaerales bacterium]|nr:right-handed parallel beta-helix repeat-containing protein [Phycisphaerales bacterium]